jgi:hypothetical protein
MSCATIRVAIGGREKQIMVLKGEAVTPRITLEEQ